MVTTTTTTTATFIERAERILSDWYAISDKTLDLNSNYVEAQVRELVYEIAGIRKSVSCFIWGARFQVKVSEYDGTGRGNISCKTSATFIAMIGRLAKLAEKREAELEEARVYTEKRASVQAAGTADSIARLRRAFGGKVRSGKLDSATMIRMDQGGRVTLKFSNADDIAAFEMFLRDRDIHVSTF